MLLAKGSWKGWIGLNLCRTYTQSFLLVILAASWRSCRAWALNRLGGQIMQASPRFVFSQLYLVLFSSLANAL